MIVSFKGAETEKIYNQQFSKRFPAAIQSRVLDKLKLINQAKCLSDLRQPPGNHLEKLNGDREGQYSVRVNQQYRICFIYQNNHLYEVELVDYH